MAAANRGSSSRVTGSRMVGPRGPSYAGRMGEPIELHTPRTRYRFAPTASGSGLLLLGWGAADSESTDAALEPPLLPGFDTEEDVLPHEFGVAGTRHVLESELIVQREDRRDGALVRMVGEPRRAPTDDGELVTCELRDDAVGLAVELSWRVSTRHDVIVRRATIRNVGDAALTLARVLTGAFSLPLPSGAVVDALAGGWCEEFTPTRIVLPRGTWSMGSRQGLTSHLWAAVATLSDPAAGAGGCWSVALAWSGSWRLDVHASPREGWVRVAAGVHDETPILLEPGESFICPELLGLWAPDADAAARAWHAFAHAELLRDVDAGRRPITYNSWYATEFDVRCDQQIDLARRAAGLGCEMFVLDDGWFAGRRDDTAGLGDWMADPAAFPEGLAPLIDTVHGLGMRFGLWVEPEAVSPDSDLYRAHPDWIHRSPDREPVTIRNQYVLDLGRPQVEAWALDTLRRLLRATGVDHLKWDMNRALTDACRAHDQHGREASVQHTRAYHRLLDTLSVEFPDVTIEACSGGGARLAASVLERSDVVWPSDETGPRDRLAIQHGFLSVYPAAVMSSWVTDLDGHRDAAPASLTYRFCVAMCGVLGIGVDLSSWSAEDDAVARTMIALYADIRPVVLGGEVQRHGDPGAHGYAVEYVGPEEDPRSVVFVFGRPGVSDPVSLRLWGGQSGPNASVDRPRPLGPWDRASGPSASVESTGGSAHWAGDALVVELDPETGAAVVVLG